MLLFFKCEKGGEIYALPTKEIKGIEILPLKEVTDENGKRFESHNEVRIYMKGLNEMKIIQVYTDGLKVNNGLQEISKKGLWHD